MQIMNIPFRVTVVICSALLSSCATSFVRSDDAAPKHLYPATAFDAEFFWETGIKGMPMVEMADRDYREPTSTRVLSCFAALIDLPVSLLTDTLFLPLDLKRMGDDDDEDPETKH